MHGSGERKVNKILGLFEMHPRGKRVKNDCVSWSGELGFGNASSNLEMSGFIYRQSQEVLGWAVRVVDLRSRSPNVWGRKEGLGTKHSITPPTYAPRRPIRPEDPRGGHHTN